MSEAWAYVGAAMLGAATLPQAWRLLRTRRADDFGWAFVGLNLGGLLFLSARSFEIREVAFLAVNVLAAGFWALALVVKARQRHCAMSARRRSAEASAESATVSSRSA